MTHALIELSEESNKVLNMVKAKYNLKDKSAAVELVIEKFVEVEGEPDLKEEFLDRVRKAEKGKFVRVSDFGKHFGV
ncbi:DUF2683 domain-containing protein [Candidatus Woesearchaeota archaeon]|nr:MAG: DUF2683 domain-containing protein [Candidatus Woesearchaeota archaeon]